MKSAIQKLYYSITEVSKIIGEEQHVLRYWEREFPQLRPQKNRAGNRVYTQRDLGVLRIIKRLLRQERYTVAGAKEYLRQHGSLDELEESTFSEETSQGAVQGIEGSDGEDRRNEAHVIVSELRSIAAELRTSAE
ncbi:MAG TPA: MerR family transcriptional regulator [Bacteroidetes bacterium]|nr:MerR family transcriptional regulator [Bacteroidota bacterium]HRK04990.1 MerR family transcriptional regulator [Chlorobiota bacterium]